MRLGYSLVCRRCPVSDSGSRVRRTNKPITPPQRPACVLRSFIHFLMFSGYRTRAQAPRPLSASIQVFMLSNGPLAAAPPSTAEPPRLPRPESRRSRACRARRQARLQGASHRAPPCRARITQYTALPSLASPSICPPLPRFGLLVELA